jgi:hypothetical protein
MGMKTKHTQEKIEWKPTDRIILERQAIADDAAQAGFFSYVYGGVSDDLLGKALCQQIQTPKEAIAICERKLDGGTFTENDVDEIIRDVFLLYGINRGFLAKSSGVFQKQPTESGGGHE